MPDTLSTGVSTDAGQGATLITQQGSPASQTPVNPAQTQQNPNPNPNQQDVTGLIASYESRLRNLMSEKDKSINERNAAIAQLAELQRTYTEERARDQNSLTNTANAAQTAITQSQTYAQQLANMQGELLRANTLLQKPHLAEYAEFIPTNQDAEQMKLLVERLEAVRLRDLERNGGGRQQQQGYNPLLAQQQQQQPNGTTPASSTNAYVPPVYGGVNPPASSLPNQSGATNPLLLVGQQQQQQNMATMGSNPAMMNSTGGLSSAQQIQTLLANALKTGDTNTYHDALQKAIAMVPSAVQQELGRS